MKKLYLLTIICLLLCCPSFSQISLTANAYTQDFNSLAPTGTSADLPKGWLFSETGTNANSLYTAGNGSGTAGDTYSFGATGSIERAFGGLQSGSLIPAIGVSFTNNSGAIINSLSIQYTGEQWRLGTAGRADRLDFQYSTDATGLTSGTWTDINQLDFSSPITTGAIGALDGNAAANRTTITYTITGLSIESGATFYMRWSDFNATGADDGLGIDDFSLSFTTSGGAADVAPPVITSLFPATNTTNIATSFTAVINFNENIEKGTGNIYIKRAEDHAIVQTIDVTSSAVTISNNQASIKVGSLSNSTGYYIAIDAGAFKDVSNNNFTGINDNSQWSFTTASPPAAGVIGTTYNFNTCGNYMAQGFQTYNVAGAQVWSCTKFGRTYTTDPSTDSAIQISGFSGTAQINEDWLISPKFDLTNTTIPLLRFYSRTAFAGTGLRLKASTNYSGSGSPDVATWVDLNGRFPAEAGDVWTVSDSINLSSFKTGNVHLAWVYTSGATAAARWTLDDITVFNSTVAPAPNITVNTASYDFGIAGAGSNSYWKLFSFTGSDFSTAVTFTVPSGFEIAKDSAAPAASITYTAAEINTGVPKTFFIRFSPNASNQVFTGSIVACGPGYRRNILMLSGSSYLMSNTLDVVNWNINWFGSTVAGNGPANDSLQEANVKTIARYLNADLYAFSEIVDTVRFRRVADSLGTTYGFAIADYASFATDSHDPDYAGAQKNGFIYNKAIFSHVTTRGLLRYHASQRQTDSSSYYWASGRFPFLLNADVALNGITKNINFIVIHAKANTGTAAEQIEAYRRRKLAAQELKDTLDTYFCTSNIVLLGDFNDDLDRTIAPATGADTLSSYYNFVMDSTDANSYHSLTLPLSLAGQHSTVSNPDVIDHVMISNELIASYVPNSAAIRTDVAGVVSNYAATTTDHYPVMTRYLLTNPFPQAVQSIELTAVKDNNSVTLHWKTAAEVNIKEFVVERSTDGITFDPIGKTAAAGNSILTTSYTFVDALPFSGVTYYRLRIVSTDTRSAFSNMTRVNVDLVPVFTIAPNPATGSFTVTTNSAAPVYLQLLDMNGKTVKTQVISHQNERVAVSGLKGIYILKLVSDSSSRTQKIILQ